MKDRESGTAPPEPPAPSDDPGEGDPGPERLSWAAYFGAATGLEAGMLVAMLVASGVHYLDAGGEWAEIVWQVASPLLALLGVIGLGLAFHRWLRGQILLPAMFFFTLLALGAWLILGPLGFPWMVTPS